MMAAPTLPLEVWNILYMAMTDRPVPYHAREEALAAFRAALQAARQAPQPEPEGGG